VDVTVKVEEQSAGSLQFGVGYSQYSGIILSASVSQNNFLGTGDSFSVGAETSTYYKRVNASYYNPYLTDNGIGIGYTVGYSKTDYGDTDFANYATSAKSFSTFLGIPISETDSLRVGLGLSSNKINLYPGYSPQVLVDYQNALGNQTVHDWTGTLGWNHDTRNGYWAPTRGGLLSLSTDIALPGSTVEHYRVSGEANHYWPIGAGFVLYMDGQAQYGNTYGNQKYQGTYGQYEAGQKLDYPFWQNFYSGGVRDVRGFQDQTLGPRVCSGVDANGKPIQPDSKGYCNGSYYQYAQPIGGAFKVLGTTELYLPLPFLKDINTARVSLFVDVGNAYKNYQSFKASDLRASAGISLHWQAPIGPLIINFATPIRSKPEDRHYEERIQFTFGSQF
jgi:outer membrane protein insertion porin family